jgi:hypothetical protein
LLRDGVCARAIGVNNGDQCRVTVLLQLVVNAGVIATKCAGADYCDANVGSAHIVIVARERERFVSGRRAV